MTGNAMANGAEIKELVYTDFTMHKSALKQIQSSKPLNRPPFGSYLHFYWFCMLWGERRQNNSHYKYKP